MAKKIQNNGKSQLESLQRIEGILQDQVDIQDQHTELLRDTKNLAEQDRLLQVGQVYEEHQIQEDEDESLKQTKEINEGIKKLAETITNAIAGEFKKLVSKDSSPITDREDVNYASKLIRTNDIIEDEKSSNRQENKNRSISTKTLDFFDKTGIVKRGSEGIFSKAYGLPALAKQEEKEKYISREKEFGSDKTEEKMGLDFEELQTTLKKKKDTENELSKTKKNLNLSDEQLTETETGKKLIEDIKKLDSLILELDSSTQVHNKKITTLTENELSKTKKNLNLSDEQLTETETETETETGKKLIEDIKKLDSLILELDSSTQIHNKKTNTPNDNKSDDLLPRQRQTGINSVEDTIQNDTTHERQIEDIKKLDSLILELDSSTQVHNKKITTLTENESDDFSAPKRGKSNISPVEDATPNDTAHEHEIEVERSNEEQLKLLRKIEENTRPKEVPDRKEEQKEASAPESNSIVGDVVEGAAGAAGAGAFGTGIKKAGQAVLSAGKTALSAGKTLLKGASRFAGPVGIAIAGGEALHEGAKAFSDSFGEGGFDVIHALHKQGIIDYNFGDSEILDWKAVEGLPDDTIQKMIDSKEFSEGDTKILEDIIKGNKLEFKPALKTETDKLYKEKLKEYPEEMQNDSSIQRDVRSEAEIEAKYNLKEKGINPYDNINGNGEIQRVGEEMQRKVRSFISPLEPTKAHMVYGESADNSEKSLITNTPSNTIVAPTNITNNNTTTKNNIRLPVRNDDDTTRKYVSSRYSK